MTIRRGQTWGEPGSLAPGAPLIDRDADLVPSVADRLEEGGPSDRGRPEVGLLGGVGSGLPIALPHVLQQDTRFRR